MVRRITLWTSRGRIETRVDDRPLETNAGAVDRARLMHGIDETEFRRGEVVSRD